MSQIVDWYSIPLGATIYECESGYNSPPMIVVKTAYEFKTTIKHVGIQVKVNGKRMRLSYAKGIEYEAYRPRLYYKPQYIVR